MINDYEFNRSVIYLTRDNDEGSIGFVINKKSCYKLSDIDTEYSDIEATIIRNIYRGDGPHLHQISRLIKYSKGTIENLALIPKEEILHANFSFNQVI